jgi:excinuclease ABC subunit C
MPIISLAKREEEIFLLGRSESLRLPRRSPALRILQQARDEAHRFAITFQRKRRAVRTVTSELLRIPGVGEAKRRQLLATFGSLQGVREAAPEAIAALPGFGQKTAERILEALRNSSPSAPPATEPITTVEPLTVPIVLEAADGLEVSEASAIAEVSQADDAPEVSAPPNSFTDLS